MGIWFLVWLPTTLSGKDFGRMGETFPIEDESLLQFMERSLSKKAIKGKILESKAALLEIAKNPTPVQGIGISKESKAFLLDPSFKATKDIRDANGTILVKAGTLVNPLESIELSSGLLFLDGDEADQLDWARRQGEGFKWILVKGKPLAIEELEGRPIYFDQRGVYSSWLQVRNTPARVTQKGRHLLIEEVVVGQL